MRLSESTIKAAILHPEEEAPPYSNPLLLRFGQPGRNHYAAGRPGRRKAWQERCIPHFAGS